MKTRARPGAGFIVLAGTALSVTTFFCWALRPPVLERVWELELELTSGERGPLSTAEFELLQATLRRYPSLAREMLDGAAAGVLGPDPDGAIDRGWAYVIRTRRDGPAVFEAQWQRHVDRSVEVLVRTLDARARGLVTADSPFLWRLPDTGPFPQLVEVRFASDGGRSLPAAPIIMRLRGVP